MHRSAETSSPTIRESTEAADGAYERWNTELKNVRLADPRDVVNYPVELWDSIAGKPSEQQLKDVLNDIWVPSAIECARFDVIYVMHSQKSTLNYKEINALFKEPEEVRKRAAALIEAGCLRSATYLIKTAEEFYPQLGIRGTEFIGALPEYPALPVSYGDMTPLVELEKNPTEPIQDLLTFYVKESLIREALYLQDEINTILSSPQAADSVRDSGIRALKLEVDGLLASLESETDAIVRAFGKQFLATARDRIEKRGFSTTDFNAKLWRDHEDVLSAVISTQGEFVKDGSWHGVATGMKDLYFAALRPNPASKGEMRGRLDHVLDRVHNGGSIFGWLNHPKGQVEALNVFPPIFLEFRRYVASEHPAKDMVAFVREFYSLIENFERTHPLLEKYHKVLNSRKPIPDDVQEFLSEYPLLAHTIQSRELPTLFIHQVIHAALDSRPLKSYLSEAFLTSLDTSIVGTERKIADLTGKIGKIRDTYGPPRVKS